MRTELFDFNLPDDRIALVPANPRDAARMLVIGPAGRRDLLVDTHARTLPDWLQPGDALVVNDTRVIPAALDGVRSRAGITAKVAFNLTKRTAADRWQAFARPAKRLALGDHVRFGPGPDGPALDATVSARLDAGEVELTFTNSGAQLDRMIAVIGQMPLPPYIALKRAAELADAAAYQTIYATHDGAVAAPTAGLHFTEGLFAALAARGVTRHTVTLHVGAGTFLPVKVDDTSDHHMHSEWGTVSAETAVALNAVRARGNRVVAVGTTSLRVLESAATADGLIHAWSGDTAIFITPGYSFRAVDVLLTNFHLPRSTLFMLVAAFAGLHEMHAAYAHAIASGYRFYSFGDASLLFRQPTVQPTVQPAGPGAPVR
jgi:S-adenosylmethionine:tRNA ribosyltransferase-isomerase